MEATDPTQIFLDAKSIKKEVEDEPEMPLLERQVFTPPPEDTDELLPILLGQIKPEIDPYEVDVEYQLLPMFESEDKDKEIPLNLRKRKRGRPRKVEKTVEVVYQKCPEVICSYGAKVAVDLSRIQQLKKKKRRTRLKRKWGRCKGTMLNCELCDFTASSLYRLKRHEVTRHESRVHRLQVREKVIAKDSISSRLQVTDPPKRKLKKVRGLPVTDKVVNKVRKRKSGAVQHLQVEETPTDTINEVNPPRRRGLYRFWCPKCRFRTTGAKYLAQHMAEDHPDDSDNSITVDSWDKKSRYSKKQTNRKVATLKAIAEDAIVEASKFSCTKCQFKAGLIEHLDYHTSRCHPQDSKSPFVYNDACKLRCLLCQYRTMSKLRLGDHVKSCHDGQSSVENDIDKFEKCEGALMHCPTCQFVTTDPVGLLNHLSLCNLRLLSCEPDLDLSD